MRMELEEVTLFKKTGILSTGFTVKAAGMESLNQGNACVSH